MASTSRASWTVLVVEDEALVRSAIADELRAAGCEVAECASAEEALALLRSGRRVDAVFTDIQLAGALTGWDVADEGRAIQPALPVVYASGNTWDRSRRVRDSLFYDKPYDLGSVVAACCQSWDRDC
jgi:CheY-like chemotaxis protein